MINYRDNNIIRMFGELSLKIFDELIIMILILNMYIFFKWDNKIHSWNLFTFNKNINMYINWV